MIIVKFNNIGSFNKWIIDKIKIPDSVKHLIGQQIVSTIKLNIVGGVDVYGKKFAPLKNPPKNKNKKILIDTSRMYYSFSYRVNYMSIEVGTNTPYARFHQLGTKHMPVRMILPTYTLPMNMSVIIKNIIYKYWSS